MVDTVSLPIALPQAEVDKLTEDANEACVGQRQQLLPQRVVELPAKVCSRPPECDTKVRTADVADEQRIAGQHGVGGGGAAIEIEDENRDRFGGMARRLECLEAHASQLHTIAVSERRERELRLRRPAKIDRRADAIAQLQVTGDEVRVKVREKDVLYLETVRVGERQILIDVALRIDDRRSARQFVANQIGRVREAIQIELMEDHGARPAKRR